jgi:hypothetical protein
MTEQPAAPRGTKTPQYSVGRRSFWLYVVVAIMFVGVAWVTLGGEQNFLSTAPVLAKVEVLEVLAAESNEGPPTYWYRVRLSEGVETRYRSAQVYRVGDHVTLLWSRGKVTGRILLTAPSRLETQR